MRYFNCSDGRQHTYNSFCQKQRGPFQSEPVLCAFSVYFTSLGIQASIPTADPGEGLRPIGALALAAMAVSENIIYVATLTNLCSR